MSFDPAKVEAVLFDFSDVVGHMRMALQGDPGTGRYRVDYAVIPGAIARLAKELLEIEATGDRQRAENWFNRYDRMPSELSSALAKISDVPVDVDPVFSFPDGVVR